MQGDLTKHTIITRVIGLLIPMTAVTAALMAWVVTREPHMIVTAVSADDARAIVFVVFDVVFQAFSTFIQYL
jgi:hypothetical protein